MRVRDTTAVPAFRLALWWSGTALAYYVGARVGLSLALVKNQVTPLWPPTGIALAALLVSRGRAWPGVALGAFAVNAPLGPTLPAALLIAAGNTLAPYVAYILLLARGFRPDLSRLRDACQLVLLGAFASMLISATLGTSVLVGLGPLPASGFLGVWWVWWAGDAMGVLLVAPLLLVGYGQARDRLGSRRLLELGLLAVATVALSQLRFTEPAGALFPIFPLVVWAALRLEMLGAVVTVSISGVLAARYAADATGAFAGLSVAQRMIRLLALNGGLAVTSYLLAALVSERQDARRDLQQSGARLEAAVAARTADLTALVAELEQSEARAAEAQELARIGSWEWRIAEDAVIWSAELYRRFGLPVGQAPRTYADYLASIHPEDRSLCAAVIESAHRTGEPFAFDHRVVHPDGSVHWVQGRGSVVRDVDGTVLAMRGTAQDIAEQRAAEAAAQQLEAVAERRRQALDLNDSIVQGLTVARFSLQLGKTDLALQTLDGTLTSARELVADLWGEHVEGAALRAGDLVRNVPAQLRRDAVHQDAGPVRGGG